MASTAFVKLGVLICICVVFLSACGESQPTLSRQSPAQQAKAPSVSLSSADRFDLGAMRAQTYQFSADGQAFEADNRAQNLRARWDANGVRLDLRGSSAHGFNLQFARWGRGGALASLAPRAPELGQCAAQLRLDEQGQCLRRLELRHEGVVEWWENRVEGLEQGFTLASRPAGAGRLLFDIDVRGARAQVEPGGAANFRNASGAVLARYSGLLAIDAKGRELPAKLLAQPAGLRILVDDRDANYPIVVDPVLTTVAWSAESDQASAEFGGSVASAGDVNGDGFADAIVGAPSYDTAAGADAGRVYVYLGSASGLSVGPSWSKDGDLAGGLLGSSVASAGDVNGDGYSDVIVGARGYGNGQTGEGRAYVYLGSSTGLAATPIWTAEGELASAAFGSAVSSAGDVNGDGYSEIAVAARGYSNGNAGEGRVTVYAGAADGPSPAPVWTLEGNQNQAAFGSSISSAGDVNGDGYSDLVVGAEMYDTNVLDDGHAFLYLGSAAGLSTMASWSPSSDQSGSRFGGSVAGAGDVNGDGYSDVIVGAYRYDNGHALEGRVFAFLGSATGLAANSTWSVESNQASSLFGSSIGSAGDVNGDGFADVIVGAHWYDAGQTDEGRAYIYLGSASGLQTAAIWTSESNQASAQFGIGVGCAGDVNGDGFSDVIVGAHLYDNAQAEEGRASVYYGAGSGPGVNAAVIFESNQAAARLQAVSGAGDVNGDGFGDLIVGAGDYDGGQTDEGRAWLYNGSASGLVTTASWTQEGNQTNARFGSAVAGAGDVNGDGYADVLVTLPFASNDLLNEGRVFLYDGSASGLATIPSWTMDGEQEGAFFGRRAISAGDVNGDGYSDVLIGASHYDNGQTDEGRAFLYLGSATGLELTPNWIGESDEADSQYGLGLAAGDFNADGYSDIVVGAWLYENGAPQEGAIFIHMGSATGIVPGPGLKIEGNVTSTRLGLYLAGAGDTNGDGYADFVAGGLHYINLPSNPTLLGQVRTYFGSAAGITAGNVQTILGTAAQPLSYNVAGGGDINGDGFAEILAGSIGSSAGTPPNEGIVRIYPGSSSGPVAAGVWTTESNAIYNQYGGSPLTGVGDLNGDGLSDIAIGASSYASGQSEEGAVYVHYGNFSDGTSMARHYVPRTYRAGTTTHILPGGLAYGNSFDVSLRGHTPFGRAPVKLSLETKPFGTPFNRTGTIETAHEDSGLAGTQLDIAQTGLADGAFHWRGRIFYEPALAQPQGWSRWFWGGTSGVPLGIHLRTSGCTGTDTDGDGETDCTDGCPNDPDKTAPGECGCGQVETDSDNDGTPNCDDLCPSNAPKVAPGVCGCATADTDNDGDGTPNCNDLCPNDAPKTAPGVCGCSTPDTDSDSDGTPNCDDDCPNDPGKIVPGLCGCGTADTDSDSDGTPNCNDLCPNNAPKIAPGVCGCATADADSDGDGTPNCNDLCPNHPPKTAPGICGCATADTDSDSDGTPDCNDGCPNNAPKTAPGICGCATPDTDSDGDGTPNCNDGCANDPSKTAPGICGCGVSDADSDGDGTLNCNDGCPNDGNKVAPGTCGCGISDADGDGDGTPNCNDGCPNDPGKLAPGTCGCGTADTDSDSDGTPNCNDACPNDSSKTAPGACGCGNSDADSDGDGTLNCNDGCPNDANKTQPGNCGCGAAEVPNCGDACPNDPSKTSPGECGCGVADTDTDTDGTPDCNDLCPNDAAKVAPGACGCGDSDNDTDGDGTANCNDGCPNDMTKTTPGDCGCGVSDADDDNDGEPNCNDGCEADPEKLAPGACGCGIADTDSDSDGTSDCIDGCPNDSTKIAGGTCGCGVADDDSDGDGALDCVDACPTAAGNNPDGCPDGSGGAGGGAGSGGSAGSAGSAGAGAAAGGTSGAGGNGGMSGGGGTPASGGSAGGGLGDAGMAGDEGTGLGGSGEGGADRSSGGSGPGMGGESSGGTTAQGGTTVGGGNAHDDGGCGCRVGARREPPRSALGMLLVIGLAFARRRRTRRAST